MATEFKYWAFISYSHSDRKWGNWLHGVLETYKMPKPLVGIETGLGEPVPRRLFPVFRDREELSTSSDLGSVISRALHESRYLIVICSPRAAGSRWVNQEILDFKRLGRTERVLDLIVDGEPNAAEGKVGFSANSECFPEALKYPLGADGNLDRGRRTEPIAADARPGIDGNADAALKLVAGILLLNYDDLKRRDQHRRRRQQRIVVTVSAALVLVFAALAGAALWQRNKAQFETKEANSQRQEAQMQRAEALKRRQEAETQRTIADEQKAEAVTARKHVEAQTATDEADLGREALLLGDQLAAAQHVSLAYEIRPQDPSARLLLRAAMSGLEGLLTVLHGGSGRLVRVEVAPESGLVLTVSMDGEACIWDPKDGLPVATFGKSGNEYNTIRTASFTPDGKRILFVNDSEAYLQDLPTGKKLPIVAPHGESFPKAVLSSDGRTVIGDVWRYGGTRFTTDLTAYSSGDGRVISRVDVPDSYTAIAVPGAGTRAILIGGPGNTGAQTPVRKVLVVEVRTGKTIAEVSIGLNDQSLPNPRGDLILVSRSLPGQPPVIYSAETGAQVAELSTKELKPLRASWSPSGRYVLSEGPASGALWDVSTWKPLHIWSNEVWYAATIDQAESLLATASSHGEISVWDLRSGRLLKQFDDAICAGDSSADTVFGSLRFSPDSRRLIYLGGGTCATIWDWQKTRPPLRVLSGHSATVRSIAFNPDGRRAVTGSDDGSAVVWNVETGAAEFKLMAKDNKPGAGVPMAEFSPDGKTVVTGASFRDAMLWDASNGSLLHPLNFDTHAIVIGDTIRIGMSRQGNRAVTFSGDGWGALWDLTAEKPLKSLHTENANVRAVSFAGDGSKFVVADASGLAFVFDALRGEPKRTVGRTGTPLLAAEIAPRAEKVLTVDDNGQITIWSMADGRALESLNSAAGSPRVNEVHFSPDGLTIIAACADNKVYTWNALTGEAVLTVAEETLPSEVNFSAPLRSDLANGTVIQAGMLHVRYSPDGAFFAGTNESGHIMIWEAKSGKQLLRFTGHTGRVTSLAFSSSGTRLGSSSEDDTARIWDLGLETRSPAEIKRQIAGIHQTSR